MTTAWPHKEIQEHHHFQPYLNVVQYLGQEALKMGHDVPDSVVGIIQAELHRGLWIARCPNRVNPNEHLRCSNAVAVDSVHPTVMCPACGDGWWKVLFPENREAIETELMKRPIPRKGLIHVNWSPFTGVDSKGIPTGRPETLTQLRRDTKELLAQYAAAGVT